MFIFMSKYIKKNKNKIEMTYTEIVNKMIGEIRPAGDSGIDVERLDNLKSMCSLVNELITHIADVAKLKDSNEHSVSKAGNTASEFLVDLEDRFY
jgi:hypothetical protein